MSDNNCVIGDSSKCFICNNIYKNKSSKKCRLTQKSNVVKLLKIAEINKDCVSDRLRSFENVDNVIEKGLNYHPDCLRKYERAYERMLVVRSSDISSQTNNCDHFDEFSFEDSLHTSSLLSNLDDLSDTTLDETLSESKLIKKRNILSQIFDNIMSEIVNGEIFSLSDIIEKAKNLSPNEFLCNRDVRVYIANNYANRITIFNPADRKKSSLFFYTDLTKEQFAEKLYYRNSIKNTASRIKECCKNVDFNLEDKFCDVLDLKKSWIETKIPPPILIFLSALLGFQEQHFLDRENFDNPFDFDEDDDDDLNSSKRKITVKKYLRINSLFQTIYYIVNNGTKKTPLHVSTAITIHSTYRAKLLTNSLHRIGFSISYDEVRRIRTSLALLTIKTSISNVPLPLHFKKDKYTIGGFDNFDHEGSTLSGSTDTHHTVMVLFQEDSKINHEKINLSKAAINFKDRVFNVDLECQVLQNFYKPLQKIFLPENYTCKNLNLSEELYKVVNTEDLCWVLSRMNLENLTQIRGKDEIQNTPLWSSYNSIVNTDNKVLQTVGFLPVLPYPVTEYSSVYTALCNFENVLYQLDQKNLAVFCDEGVYRIARHLKFLCPDKFKNITVMLGGFHMCKVLLACIGKYLTGSGVDLMFIETDLYGPGVTEQILNGSNYARSVNSFLLLGETLLRLQLTAFFKENSEGKYNNELATVKSLQDSIAEKSNGESKRLYEMFNLSCEKIYSDFSEYVKKRCKESQLFEYWTNVLKLIQVLRDHIRAERLSDFQLYIETLKKVQPIFHVFDRTNYIRYSAIQLQDMLALPTTSPELYEKFEQGFFTVKRKKVGFTSVSPDQALEQTINRAQGCTKSGIIGVTKNKQFVAAWELIFHEILAIRGFFEEITYVKNYDFELNQHHDLSYSKIDNTELQIEKLTSYICNKVNPFKNFYSSELCNIVTQEKCAPDVAKTILKVFQVGCELFNDFNLKRFFNKEEALSETIHRVNFPSFKAFTKITNTPAKPLSIVKENKISQRVIELARERGFNLKKLFTFELSRINSLFDENNLIKKMTDKSKLTLELEKKIDYKIISLPKNIDNFCLAIDVMYVCRVLKWKQLTAFKDFANAFCKYISENLKIKVTRIDFVCDSYIELSIKNGERLYRYGEKSIDLNAIYEDTPMPVQEKLFWSSDKNKTLLQKFLRNFILRNGNTLFPGIELVFSATNELCCQTTYLPDNELRIFKLQNKDIEEADTRIMLHINHAVLEKFTHVFILSTDTDILVLALYFFNKFRENGLKVYKFKKIIVNTILIKRIIITCLAFYF